MSDLPEFRGSINLTNGQRRHAALSLAEISEYDPHRLAYFLCALGLARHQGDGTFTSLPETDRWYSRPESLDEAPFSMAGPVDDCR